MPSKMKKSQAKLLLDKAAKTLAFCYANGGCPSCRRHYAKALKQYEEAGILTNSGGEGNDLVS